MHTHPCTHRSYHFDDGGVANIWEVHRRRNEEVNIPKCKKESGYIFGSRIVKTFAGIPCDLPS